MVAGAAPLAAWSVRRASGMFDTARSPCGAVMCTSNETFWLGSSKHGKARRASFASNCVNAYHLSPSFTR